MTVMKSNLVGVVGWRVFSDGKFKKLGWSFRIFN
ncbi:hypothetical protein JOC48_002117 [Aquibacillus albus]|uniref:Uncharacterized protein n=1 Tax=Aquibacillus albus TaxID=1168171 RepID=A0ABS2N0D0_9BACI|nr:hypothetical protein [Aquibacillus albus]